MTNPSAFYTSEKSSYESELISIKKKLQISAVIRLILFIAIIAFIYFFYNNIQILISVALVGILTFLYLVARHTNMQNSYRYINELIVINNKELQIFDRDFFEFDNGSIYDDSSHYYSYDIDLFGKGSFFQFINRTVTKEGEQELTRQLKANSISNISAKQEGIKELAKMPKWRQDFSAIGNMVDIQYPANNIIKWIKSYTSTLPKKISYLPKAFGLISVLLIVFIILNILSYQYLMGWFFIGLFITGVFRKKTSTIYNKAGKAKDTFAQYHRLLDKVENASFESEILKAKQQAIQTDKEKASVIFRKFSKILDGFDQRNNMIIAILGNGLFLWDILFAEKVENWIETYDEKIEDWFEVISFFDAMNTLANFGFNHPSYVFPSIQNNDNIIKADQLGHPLLKVKNRVDNDFLIQDQQFFIITGANMAGKSTFLRTVSLSIVMANMGLPVCAKSFEYTPIKLITSMRTSDSLVDDESYFFSELKRLKFIVEEIKTDKYFIILDEILKGTNSTDKAIGSKKFVQKLVASNSTGIIATHDLSLCAIENKFSQIKNYYFDAEIEKDELHFDYHLKNGICQNMNASFLLKKMEII